VEGPPNFVFALRLSAAAKPVLGYPAIMLQPAEIVANIQESEKLTKIFGRWPSFHDAEVHELRLSRSSANKPGSGLTLTLMIHLWTMTTELNSKGQYLLEDQTLATIAFREIEDLHLEGFNHQNVIWDISITQETTSEDGSPQFSVALEPCYGIDASFRCRQIEVLDAHP
jgi:hypothetical protein